MAASEGGVQWFKCNLLMDSLDDLYRRGGVVWLVILELDWSKGLVIVGPLVQTSDATVNRFRAASLH